MTIEIWGGIEETCECEERNVTWHSKKQFSRRLRKYENVLKTVQNKNLCFPLLRQKNSYNKNFNGFFFLKTD